MSVALVDGVIEGIFCRVSLIAVGGKLLQFVFCNLLIGSPAGKAEHPVRYGVYSPYAVFMLPEHIYPTYESRRLLEVIS